MSTINHSIDLTLKTYTGLITVCIFIISTTGPSVVDNLLAKMHVNNVGLRGRAKRTHQAKNGVLIGRKRSAPIWSEGLIQVECDEGKSWPSKCVTRASFYACGNAKLIELERNEERFLRDCLKY
jgi:hypothetical protein